MSTSFRQVVSSRKMAFQPPTYERSDRSMSSTVVREFQPPMDSMHLRRLRSQETDGQAHATDTAHDSCSTVAGSSMFLLLKGPSSARGAI